MAFEAADWSIDRQTGDIRYIGDDHTGAAPSYATVIQFHRALQDFADDAVSSGNDELDITDDTPSDRSTDNIITLLGNYNIDDNAAEHLYDGSIIQADGDEIYDGVVNFGNPEVQIQIIQNGAVLSDDWWNYQYGGAHDGSNDASVLTDSGESWTTDEFVGYVIQNTTDGSSGIITANTATTITATLAGGTDNDWDTSDNYLIGVPLNADSTNGISHRFLIKVRTAGADIDLRKVIGTTRVYTQTFSEFTINATSRGNNVLALSNTNDLNNQTAYATIDGYTDIVNDNEGYVGIDASGDGSNEFYYSDWEFGTRSVNDFYERAKLLTADGSSETLYGLSGELFRGITHQIALNTAGTNSGTFTEPEQVSWTGGTGQLLAIEDTTASAADTMWIQLLTGTPPGNAVLITGGTSSATATTASSSAVTERSLSIPFVGASTGSAIIGAYGLGIGADDLTASDTVFDLGNNQVTPPNNVTFTVNGLVSGEDRVLVGPLGHQFDYDGELSGPFTVGETLTFTSPAGTAKLVELIDNGVTGTMVISEPLTGSLPTDNSGITGGTSSATASVNGSVGNDINSGQLTLNTGLTTDNITSVVVDETIPSDTPSSGTIRLQDDDGLYRLLDYSSYTGSTFTITTTDGNEDFAATNATAGNNVFISYIDTLAGSTSESFTSVFNTTRSLFIRVRDGDSTPIKTFETTGTLGSAGGSTTAIRTSDE